MRAADLGRRAVGELRRSELSRRAAFVGHAQPTDGHARARRRAHLERAVELEVRDLDLAWLGPG